MQEAAEALALKEAQQEAEQAATEQAKRQAEAKRGLTGKRSGEAVEIWGRYNRFCLGFPFASGIWYL